MTTENTAARRARRSDKPRQHRRVDLHRMRRRRVLQAPPPPDFRAALYEIMEGGDVFLVGAGLYLVSPISRATLERLIIVNSLGEDDEENGDSEPSIIGSSDDLESDGLEFSIQGITACGESDSSWANEGSQEHLHCNPGGSSDHEPELGWANTGSQLWAHDGRGSEAFNEGDPLDHGEGDPCDLGEPAEEDGFGYVPTEADAAIIAQASARYRARGGRRNGIPAWPGVQILPGYAT